MQIDLHANQARPLAFSLYYFGSDEGGPQASAQRRLIFESARFADDNGFSAVWSPERHFHAFGGLSPNPSVMAAALAAITTHVRIRSGSVVVPLHHPARVVEEWSMVDFLSSGRVDLSLASRPVQRELPIWITAAGNPETFRRAGAMGLNLLTHLLGQSLESLADKIMAYRQAWREAGHAGQGTVTLMLHTFVGQSEAEVRRKVKAPMLRYLASSANLVGRYTAAVPFFQKQCAASALPATQDDLDEALEFSFERYYATSSLLGTLDDCLSMTDKLKAIEVDEVACLIDFGVDPDEVLAALPALAELRDLAQVPMSEEELLLGG